MKARLCSVLLLSLSGDESRQFCAYTACLGQHVPKYNLYLHDSYNRVKAVAWSNGYDFSFTNIHCEQHDAFSMFGGVLSSREGSEFDPQRDYNFDSFFFSRGFLGTYLN